MTSPETPTPTPVPVRISEERTVLRPPDPSDHRGDARPGAATLPAEGDPAPREGDPAGAAESRAVTPARIGRYKLRRELGRGGMGVVYLAYDPDLRREVALKLLAPGRAADAEVVLRFHREAQAVAALAHPAIVAIFEVGEGAPAEGAPTVPYFTMEFVAGGSLAQRIRERGRLSPAEAMRTLREVAAGVAFAHERGIVHRDIKPENILLEPGPPAAAPRPKLSDFGLARIVEQEGSVRLTATRVILGTPAYMAPEQARGDARDIDARSDVYGLGAVLYEALTGRPPCAGDSPMDVLLRKLAEDPVRPRVLVPTLAPDVETIVLKALERDPARRYPTARELADDLGRCLEGEAIHARAPSVPVRVRRWVSRHRLAAVILVAVGVIGLVLAGFLADRARRERLHERAVAEAGPAAVAERAARRDRAMPDHLLGLDALEKSRMLVRMNKLDRRRERLEQAERSFSTAIEADPEFAEAWAGRAEARAELGDSSHTLADLERAIELSPRSTEAYLMRIQTLSLDYETLWSRGGRVHDLHFESLTELPDLRDDPEAQRLDAAIRADVAKVVALGIKPEQTHYFHGWLLRAQGDLDGALREFDAALEVWPYFAAGWEGRASLLLIRPQPDLALAAQDVDRALKLDPGSLRARGLRFYLALRRGEHLPALAELQFLLQLRPRAAPLYVLRGYLKQHHLKDPAGARADFEEALRHDPACILALLNLGVAHYDEGRLDEAIETFTEAARRNDRHALVYYFRAMTHLRAARPEPALDDLGRAVDIDPTFARAWLDRLRLHAQKADLAAVWGDAQRMSEHVALDYESSMLAAIAGVRLDHGKETLELCDREEARGPGRAHVPYVRGLVLLELGRPEEAAAAFERTLARKPDAALEGLARRQLETARKRLEEKK